MPRKTSRKFSSSFMIPPLQQIASTQAQSRFTYSRNSFPFKIVPDFLLAGYGITNAVEKFMMQARIYLG